MTDILLDKSDKQGKQQGLCAGFPLSLSVLSAMKSLFLQETVAVSQNFCIK